MHTLYLNITKEQLPIIYRKEYNVKFCGLERLHPFDTRKWGNIFKILTESGILSKNTVVVPNEATNEHLSMVHKKKYLKSLKCSFKVAQIAEVAPLILVPNCLIQKAYLRPMRFQTGGSILAGKLALERGWAINIGGGFHHCSSSKGGGFCVYADITLLIHFLFYHFPKQVQKVMIVDLDAHQGNGYQNDFKDNDTVYIMDVYNKWIYPKDIRAKEAINKNVPLDYYTDDELYLRTVKRHLKPKKIDKSILIIYFRNFLEALCEFTPHIIVYNAGTDVLAGDKLGGLSISEQGIISRDEFVFQQALSRKIPIVMLTSGGYQKKTARVIANSILNLYELGLINNSQEYYF
ncbi:histone deacetylase 11 isoform X1 [Euwallacea fornicatus]|uniref:histone deacetylase 11 isoform X1 n=1 Tax=Euwallacea fornicatus TaxID=995702 RepID=UPI00338DB3F4